MSVFCGFQQFFRWVIRVNVFCAILCLCVVYPVAATEVEGWCSAGNFGVADLFSSLVSSNAGGDCEQCPIGSYNANTDSNFEPDSCTACGSGFSTASVGQTTSGSCVACSNDNGGVATWKSSSFVRKTFQDPHPDLQRPDWKSIPAEWCDPDSHNGYYCNIGRVVGLCEISTCDTGYTLKSGLDESKNGIKTYAIGRVEPTQNNDWRDLTCYVDSVASWTNCENNGSTFAGMDYGEWMVRFDYTPASSGTMIPLHAYKNVYGESKCIGNSFNQNNTTAGKYCWCHATGLLELNGVSVQGQVDSKKIVSDAKWKYVTSYTDNATCVEVCPNYCAQQVSTSSSVRSDMFKDSDGKPVFATKCQINSYSIVYDLNGGTSGGSQPASATYNEVFNVTNPTKTGLVFLGWNITGMDSTTHDYGSAQNSLTQHTTATSLLNVTRTWFQNLRATSGTVTFTAQWGCATGYTVQECPLRGVNPQKDGEGYKYVDISTSSYEINNTELFPGEWSIMFPYGTVRGRAQCVNNGNTWDCQCKPTMFSDDNSFAPGHAQGIGTISWVNVTQFQSQSACEAACASKCAGNISSNSSFREAWGKCGNGCQPNVCFVNYYNVSNGNETWPSPKMTPALFSAETPVASFTVSNPSRPMHAFVSWCENAGLTNCSNPMTIATNSCTADQSTINLYANWNQLYTLSYVCDNGETPPSSTNVAPGNLRLLANKNTACGGHTSCETVRWNCVDANNNNVNVVNVQGQSGITMPAANVICTLVRDTINYVIHIDADGGQGNVTVAGQNLYLPEGETFQCLCGTTVTLPEWGQYNTLTQNGKVFTGWTDYGTGNAITGPFNCADTRVVATWCDCVQNCTAGSNSASCSYTGVANNSCGYNYSCSTGYNNNGVTSGTYYAAAGTCPSPVTGPSCSGNEIVLQWYSQNTQLSNEPQSCIYGTPYSAATGAISPIVQPTRLGYDFAGWTVTGHQP